MVERLQVGVISATHGLKGEVKVYPTTDDPERFLDLDEVILESGKTERRVKLRNVRFFKKFVILGFEGMNRIEDVQNLHGASLMIDRKDAMELFEREYFIPDLLGMKVSTEDGEAVGILREVLQTGANDVYVIEREGQKDLLLPAISQCVKEVDVENGTMKIWIMPGLEDL